MDPIKKQEILDKILAQLDFTNKTSLQKETIRKIYDKYFGDDEAQKLLVLEEVAEEYDPVA